MANRQEEARDALKREGVYRNFTVHEKRLQLFETKLRSCRRGVSGNDFARDEIIPILGGSASASRCCARRASARGG